LETANATNDFEPASRPIRGGEMGALIRKYDWARTSLGPLSAWPQSLMTMTEALLLTPVPMVLLWGPDGIMIYNDAYSIVAGGRHPHLLGSKVREGWPEVSDFNDHVMKVCLGGATLSYRDQELSLLRKGTAETVWMDLDYSPVLDESGRPAGVLAVVVETSERVMAQRALVKAEERLSYALEASGMVGIFDWHIQSDTFYSDARFAEMFSVAPEKGVSGTTLSDYIDGIHPEDRDRIAKLIEHTIASGETFAQEYRLLKRDGTVRWIEARGECLYDENGIPARFPGVVVDITDRKEAERALRESEERWRIASEAARIGVWDYDLVTDTIRWDDRTRALFGLPPDAPVTYRTFEAGLHPDDRAGAEAAIAQALDPGGSGEYEIEFRTVGLEDGVVRWIAARGKCYFENARAVRFIGTVLDIGAAKEAEARQQLLLAEMNHRVKNLFALVDAMVSLSARSAATPRDMAHALRGRLDALLRAKDLVSPGLLGDGGAAGQHSTIEALVMTVLRPYEEADGRRRLTLSGPEVQVGAGAATSLALLLHESATNATKYGALSKADGSIRITWTTHGDDFTLTWEETGGPPIHQPPQRQGFGSVLAERSIVGQLGGTIDYEWLTTGLRLTLRIPRLRLES